LTVTPGTIPAGGQAPRVIVQWGDGTQTDLGTVAAARTAVHTYSSPGTFTVTAFATADGETTSSSTTIIVNPTPPLNVGVSAGNSTPARCQPVTFTATVTPNEPVSSFDWEIVSSDPTENETVRTGSQLTRTFRSAGTKSVKVVATTPDGRTGAAQTQINVQPAPPPPTPPFVCS
jgi:hypothetical protein